ncbi:hypothetical protein GCK72_011346 [Caenorhabditis remanei]|uniref:RING-type domain-containing protein n=1 Tax=Caenorhabditis remanei TaxID=31234 RepID=A0A6A5H894_CAERE|nr:hypothetical protein GCK72_011346 [Caenorhabditis remanei]KAF1763081.1 hypothetical protein GCK72_011346 [Caenorhabditis remanei]
MSSLQTKTKKIDVPVSRDVEPSAPVEELEDTVPRDAQRKKQNENRPVNQFPTLSECPICTDEYSDTVIPRILTQCGHTVCEKCARKLLGHQVDITCPVCRKVTSVDGTVENLAKNFAVIEMARGN